MATMLVLVGSKVFKKWAVRFISASNSAGVEYGKWF